MTRLQTGQGGANTIWRLLDLGSKGLGILGKVKVRDLGVMIGFGFTGCREKLTGLGKGRGYFFAN